MDRTDEIDYFYELIHEFEDRVKGKRKLENCNGRMGWPKRGVYFFFEPGEFRHEKNTLRVVRVGTHALKTGSKTTLWNRLRQHRGTMTGSMKDGGNHRGSIFRLHVGTSILRRDQIGDKYPTWGIGQSAPRETRVGEYSIEVLVSKHIRSMPFLWLNIEDSPGPSSLRGYIERNSIGLLSNYMREPIDPPSPSWLGKYCPNVNIQLSGLWNSNHVDQKADANYLITLERIIKKTR